MVNSSGVNVDSIDELDDLLGVGPEDAASARPVPAIKAVKQIDDETPDENLLSDPSDSNEEPAKPKRSRRTKAQMEADRTAEKKQAGRYAAATMSEAETQAAYLAELQKRLKTGFSTQPKSESALTPLERQIRDAEDQVAAKVSDDMGSAEPAYEPAGGADVLLIHVVNDGLVINGQSVYRGQEFEFDLDGRAYEQTKDRNGDTFLSIVDDVDAQYARWGEQKIASGPWRGKRTGYTAKDAPANLKQEEKVLWLADMRAHEAAESRRSKAAPVMNMFV